MFCQVRPRQPEEFVLTGAEVFGAEVEDVAIEAGVVAEKIP